MVAKLKSLSPVQTDNANDRHLSRAEPRSGLRVFRVVIPTSSGMLEAEVLDYHFRGASLSFKPEAFNKFCELRSSKELNFYIGSKCIKYGLTYRVCWLDTDTCQAGIEFLNEFKDWVDRDIRIPTNPKIKPSISCSDPMDPNRQLYFGVENVSPEGMLLSTSLSNKHLFPGMDLLKSKLSIPGKEVIDLDLIIQNVRLSGDKDNIHVGVAIKSSKKQQYSNLFQDYLSSLGGLDNVDQSKFKSSSFFTKKLKSSLTFHTISTNEEYRKVLALRFSGYGEKGKVRQGQTLEDMGEGLENEGLILGAYLGKLLVGSVELRFGSEQSKPFRFCTDEKLAAAGIFNKEKYVEINKLVVHPKYQGTDILLGIFHRMHAIGVSGGGLGAIIAATDQLKGLYLNIGARDAGIKVPHPHLTGVCLNILVVEAEVYMGQNNFNPFLWKAVYGTLHQYLESYQISKKPKQTISKYIKGVFEISLFYLKKKFKKNKKSGGGAKIETSGFNQRPQVINNALSKFTEQHIHVSQIKPYLMVAIKKIGKEKVVGILNEIGIGISYFDNKTNWVSVDFLDAFLDAYSAFGSLEEISVDAAILSISKEFMGINYFVLKNFGSHPMLIKIVAQFTPRLNKTRTVKVLELRKSSAIVEVGLAPGFKLPKHKESCLNWQSCLKQTGLLAGGEVFIKKVKCAYEGTPNAIYEISWIASSQILRSFVTFSMILFSLLAPLLMKVGYTSSKLVYFASLATSISVLYLLYSEYKKIQEDKERDDQTIKLQEEADAKYADLQKAKSLMEHRYQEALLLDRISVMIQKSSDLGTILRTGLQQACELLDYDRAFVMILNPDSNKLETAAVFGVSSEGSDVSKFSVDVSVKRENPALLSSVYHSGQSVLINNVSDHMFQLNEASRALIKKLSVDRFVMAAIPSQNRNWGVVVAEKSLNKGELSKKDIVLLERVGQMMGMALDKHAALENETRLRKSFQRYVPDSVIESLMTSKSTHLGGVEKKICCLFLDIRSFTKISSQIGPQMSVDLLNRFFSFVQPIFSRHGGVVDKYLGDGVFVTWGALSKVENMEIKAVLAATEVLGLLPQFNQSSVIMGLPEIRVGMGIHAGPAIVGNVGSADRLEFTSIGHTVNYASRLESLNKVYGSHLCISDEVLGALPSEIESRFSRKTGVVVRGISDQTNIGLLNSIEESEERAS